jgi:hypothetical protein
MCDLSDADTRTIRQPGHEARPADNGGLGYSQQT